MRTQATLLRIAALIAVASLTSRAALAAPPAPSTSTNTTSTTSSATKPNATELFKAGEAKYKASDYAGALADFTAADAAAPSVESARYIGLCEDKLGHYRAAAPAYNRFLAHPPAKLAEDVGATVTRVREIEQMPGVVHIDVDPRGASLTIDGAPERNTAPYEARLTPGKHLIRASAPDHEALEREVSVTFASSQDVALTLTAVPPPPPVVVVPPPPAPPPAPMPQLVVVTTPPPAAPMITRRTVAWGAAGVAVIGAGLATTFGVLALNNKSDYQNHPTLANSDQGNNDAAYADGAIALGVIAGVTSVVLFLTADDADAPATATPATAPAPTRAATVTASPFFTAHGGGAGALVRF